MKLSNKQIKYLKTLAHDKKPVVIIGGNGLTDGVINETDIVLETHELVKIKVNADSKDERMAMVEKLTEATESNFIQLIGKIAILYRQRPKNPTIELPKK